VGAVQIGWNREPPTRRTGAGRVACRGGCVEESKRTDGSNTPNASTKQQGRAIPEREEPNPNAPTPTKVYLINNATHLA